MDIKRIKLNKLSDDALAQRQLQGIKGGDNGVPVCGCGCCYAGAGGSSSHDNLSANSRSGYSSPGCENEFTPRTYE